MATIKEINHDSSTVLGDFYDTIVGPTAMAVNTASELGNSVNGVERTWTGFDFLSTLREDFTTVNGQFRWRFRIDFSNTTIVSDLTDVFFARLQTGAGGAFFTFSLGIDGGFFEIGLDGYNDDTGIVTILPETLLSVATTTEMCVEIRAIPETADGNADGQVQMFINGDSKVNVADQENFNRFATGIARTLISFSAPGANLTGSMYYDEWLLTDVNGTSLCGGTLTIASMTKPASIDASGEFVYVALLGDTFPILSKISTDLDADGVTVFDPGSGSNIGVECGRFDNTVVWIAGTFDGTNRVEKSEDSGDTFAVKDPATFGGVTTFVVGPDSDDRVLIIDTGIDIQETIDSGGTWTEHLSGSGIPAVTSVERLDTNVQEMAIGTESDTPNNINYTVNSGTDLEDIEDATLSEENIHSLISNS